MEEIYMFMFLCKNFVSNISNLEDQDLRRSNLEQGNIFYTPILEYLISNFLWRKISNIKELSYFEIIKYKVIF